MIIKQGSFLPGSDQSGRRDIYNINLFTGKILTNSELLEYCELSLDDYKTILNNYYDEMDSVSICSGSVEDSYNCHREFMDENIEKERLIVKDGKLIKLNFTYNKEGKSVYKIMNIK